MDFSLTKEQQDIKMAAREFAEKEFSRVAQEYDENEKTHLLNSGFGTPLILPSSVSHQL